MIEVHIAKVTSGCGSFLFAFATRPILQVHGFVLRLHQTRLLQGTSLASICGNTASGDFVSRSLRIVRPNLLSSSDLSCVLWLAFNLKIAVGPILVQLRSVFSATHCAKPGEILSRVVHYTAFYCTLVKAVVRLVQLRSEVEVIYPYILLYRLSTIVLSSLGWNSLFAIGTLELVKCSLTSQLLDCLPLIVCTCVILHIFVVDVNRRMV